MNIPFPKLTPRLIDLQWFDTDSPCDEDAELTALEKSHQEWLRSFGEKDMNKKPLGLKDPKPVPVRKPVPMRMMRNNFLVEEAVTDEIAAGMDEILPERRRRAEDEELRTSNSRLRNGNEVEPEEDLDFNWADLQPISSPINNNELEPEGSEDLD